MLHGLSCRKEGSEGLPEPQANNNTLFLCIEKFGLLFGLDEKNSEHYLEALKKAAQNQTWDAEMQVNESPDFPAVYAYLMENSDDSSYESGLGFNAYLTEVFSAKRTKKRGN